MLGLPPLRYLRKTTLIFVVVFLCFLGHRLYVMFCHAPANDVAPTELVKNSYSVVCRNIVNGAPFGVDSVFQEHSRLYYYSPLKSVDWGMPGDSVRHVWFSGADTVERVACEVLGNFCVSSIAPELLHGGQWSVDAIQGSKLLSSRQFKVEAAGL